MRSLPSDDADDEPDVPTIHATRGACSACNAMRPCASVSARMNAVAAEREQDRCRGCRGELVAEQHLADQRADECRRRRRRRRRRRARSSRAGACRLRKSSCLPRPRGAPSFGQQRGLHRLEQQDRDAGDEEAGDELPTRVLLAAGREHDRAEVRRRTRAPARAPSRRAATRARSTAPSTARPGRGAAGRAGRAARSRTATNGGSDEREAVGPAASTPTDERARCTRRGGRCLRRRASCRTAPKRPLPDERAAAM